MQFEPNRQLPPTKLGMRPGQNMSGKLFRVPILGFQASLKSHLDRESRNEQHYSKSHAAAAAVGNLGFMRVTSFGSE